MMFVFQVKVNDMYFYASKLQVHILKRLWLRIQIIFNTF